MIYMLNLRYLIKPTMTKPVDRNTLIASNLILVSAALGVINFLILGSFISFYQDCAAFFSIAFVVLMAFLARQGFKWIKWVFAILFICGVPFTINALSLMFHQNILSGIISVLQVLVQLTALILLFVKAKKYLEPVIQQPISKTLFDYNEEWKKLVDKGLNNFSSLTRDERVWFTVESLINAVDNGGLISHYYNSGADFNKETIEDLDFLGSLIISDLLRKINNLFPNAEVSTDLNARNDVISNWPDGEYDNLFSELDSLFYSHETELEKSLVKHIESKILLAQV